MSQEPEHEQFLPLNTIRAESALSRFPVHRLSSRGNVNIEIRETNEGGELTTKWKVSYNSEYGQPGSLAYKIDTLSINRKFDEIGRPLPTLIRLESLSSIAAEFGSNKAEVKKALYQNAFAAIAAKITYKGKDRAEKNIEAGFTRYSVIFTGEILPDGRKADAVYLLLNEIYRDILNTAQTRPLDYDYLKELSPGAQRLYELLSFQIFGAFANKRPRAKMLYSYFCTRAPQTRYFDYEHVKKQMYKLHAPHKRSGYIAVVEFKETIDNEGRVDWEMLYTPGRKAKAEFKIFAEPSSTSSNKRNKPDYLASLAKTDQKPPQPKPSVPETVTYTPNEEGDPLINELVGHGVHTETATELVSTEPEEVKRQLEFLPHRTVKRNKAGLLRDAVLGHWTPPDEYLAFQRKEQEKRESGEQRKKRATEVEQAKLRQRDEDARRTAYFDYLRVRAGETEKTQPEGFAAFINDSAAKRVEIEKDPSHNGQAKRIYLRLFDDEESHLERFREFYGEPTLEQWVLQHA